MQCPKCQKEFDKKSYVKLVYAIITALVVVALVGIFVRVVIKKDEIKEKLEPLLSR